jgi:hypothetical protein
MQVSEKKNGVQGQHERRSVHTGSLAQEQESLVGHWRHTGRLFFIKRMRHRWPDSQREGHWSGFNLIDLLREHR